MAKEAVKQPKTARKATKGSFKPGQTANPKGRPPKGYSLAEFMRAKLEENNGKRLERLFNVMYKKATDPDTPIGAAQEILTRAYGKPVDTLKVEDTTKRTPPNSTLEAMTRLGFTTTGSQPHSQADWSNS